MSALLYPFINERSSSPSSSPASSGWNPSAGGAPGGLGFASPGWQSSIPAGADPVNVIAGQLKAVDAALAPASTQELLSTWNLMHNATGLSGQQQQLLSDFLLKNTKPLQDKLKEAQDWVKNITGRDQSLTPETLAQAPPKTPPTTPCAKECDYIKPKENATAPQNEYDRLRTNEVTPSDEPPKPIQYDFGEGEEDALQYTSKVNGKDIPIIVPASENANESAAAINSSLGVLDPDASSRVDAVVVNPYPHPDDTEFETPDGRIGTNRTSGETRMSIEKGKATNSVILYPSAKDIGMDYVMLHEAAHPKITINSGDLPEKWDEVCKTEKPGPSDYGDKDSFEDFCESTALYKAAKGGKCEAVFEEAYPERYKIMEKIYRKE